MNERIQELATQAGIRTNLDTDYFDKDMNKWVDFFSQEFAELLVRECLDIINQPNGVGDDDVIRISNDVKKHFGVQDE